MRNVTDNKQYFQTIVLPRVLVIQALRSMHDQLGHNGTRRTYMLIRRLYYWKGLKASVNNYIKQYLNILSYIFPLPGYLWSLFIWISLVFEPYRNGHQYALIVL